MVIYQILQLTLSLCSLIILPQGQSILIKLCWHAVCGNTLLEVATNAAAKAYKHTCKQPLHAHHCLRHAADLWSWPGAGVTSMCIIDATCIATYIFNTIMSLKRAFKLQLYGPLEKLSTIDGGSSNVCALAHQKYVL